MERLVKLELLGQEYPLRTDASDEDVREVIHLVQSQVEGYSRASSRALPLDKIAILASVNLAGEYLKIKKDYEKYKRAVAVRTERLTEKVANELKQQI